jgi:hypothetical protein
MAQSYFLQAGHTLSVTVNEGRAHVRSGSDSAFTRSSVSFGPFMVGREFLVDGDVAVSIAAYTAAPLIVSNAGAPDDAAQAALTLNPAGDDNSLIFTARASGAEGNSISVAYVDPGGTTAALAVSVHRQAITVSLARAASAITSTAAEIMAAIQADGLANQLVTVALDEADTNFVDGSGVVAAAAAAALEGGEGTAIGMVPGGLLVDTENANTYRNDGTAAAPVWVMLGDAP